MDATDFKILEILQSDGRISMKKLADQINMSTPATTERVRKLEENQSIVGYKAIIRPDLVGREVSAFIQVRSTEIRGRHFINISNPPTISLMPTNWRAVTRLCCMLVVRTRRNF